MNIPSEVLGFSLADERTEDRQTDTAKLVCIFLFALNGTECYSFLMLTIMKIMHISFSRIPHREREKKIVDSIIRLCLIIRIQDRITKKINNF
jgi:hypothetical protein